MSFLPTISGRIWIFGSNVDTDQILPGYAMAEPAEHLHRFALAGSEHPDFANQVQPGDIIIAGDNFGQGSSREQAAVALKNSGVGAVIAPSFARIFRRNAINIGLPVLKGDLRKYFSMGQEAEVNLNQAKVKNLSTDQSYDFEPLSSNIMATLEAGGLIERVRKELNVD